VVLGDGSVASVNPVVALSTRFVNSSAHQFLSCLDALATRRAQLTQAITRYNRSASYVAEVLAYSDSYAATP